MHLYQRPDGPLAFDSTRTSLAGTNLEVRFAKVGGKRLRFETAYQRRSPGFEINDIGFLRQADQQAWTTWAKLAFRNPNRLFRELRWNFNNWEYWTLAGLPTERAFNTNVHTQFNNRWWLHMGGTLGQIGATYCDRCARGGPASGRIRTSPRGSASRATTGRALVPTFWVNYFRGDRGSSGVHSSWSPELELKVSTRFTTSLSATYERNRNDTQYFGTFTDSAGAAALHLRPPGAEDPEPHLAPGLYLHAEHLAPGLRVTLHLQGDVHRRAGDRPAARRVVRSAVSAL